MSSTSTPRWNVVHASVRGASHRSAGAPNQDAIATVVGPPTVVALADGHGSPQSARSDLGAQVAVKVAIDTITATPDLELDDAALIGVLHHHAEQIIESWVGQIELHHRSNPLTPTELDRIPTNADSLTDPLRLYGTTLIAIVFGARTIGIIQLGDGDVVVRSASGEVIQPLPVDDQLVAGETTSLCLPDAGRFVRVALIDHVEQPIDFVLVATDGYGNAFADASWPIDVGNDLGRHLNHHGLDWIGERLPAWISESAEVGGDDVTIAVIAKQHQPADPSWAPPQHSGESQDLPRKDISW